MPQEVDDFTIPLDQSTDTGACDLKVYSNWSACGAWLTDTR